jgi:hypothetical protein
MAEQSTRAIRWFHGVPKELRLALAVALSLALGQMVATFTLQGRHVEAPAQGAPRICALRN